MDGCRFSDGHGGWQAAVDSVLDDIQISFRQSPVDSRLLPSESASSEQESVAETARSPVVAHAPNGVSLSSRTIARNNVGGEQSTPRVTVISAAAKHSLHR